MSLDATDAPRARVFVSVLVTSPTTSRCSGAGPVTHPGTNAHAAPIPANVARQDHPNRCASRHEPGPPNGVEVVMATVVQPRGVTYVLQPDDSSVILRTSSAAGLEERETALSADSRTALYRRSAPLSYQPGAKVRLCPGIAFRTQLFSSVDDRAPGRVAPQCRIPSQVVPAPPVLRRTPAPS